jgi:hypothetical protein
VTLGATAAGDRRPAAGERRCAEHPHRVAGDRCDHCRRPFCGQCLVRGRPQLLCRRCWQEAPAREARARRRRHRLYRWLDGARANRASVAAGACIVVALALLGLASAAPLLNPAYRQRFGEAVAAAGRVPGAAGQAGATQPTATRLPTLIRAFLPPAPVAIEETSGTNLAALHDGRVGPDAPTWRSPPGILTPELRFRVDDRVPVGTQVVVLG